MPNFSGVKVISIPIPRHVMLYFSMSQPSLRAEPPLSGDSFPLFGFFDHGLQAVQEIRCPLRMGGGAEYRPLVVVQHLEPALDIGVMIGARFRRQGKIGAKKRRAQLGNKFLAGIAFIAPALAPEFAVKALLVLCPVSQFVRKGRIVGLSYPEPGS